MIQLCNPQIKFACKKLATPIIRVCGLTRDILLKAAALSIRFSAAFFCFVDMLCCILSLEKTTTDTRSWQVVGCCYSNRVFSRDCCFQSLGMRAYSTAGWESSISKSSASLQALLYGNWTVFSHWKPRVTACLLTYRKTWPWEFVKYFKEPTSALSNGNLNHLKDKTRATDVVWSSFINISDLWCNTVFAFVFQN